MNVTPAPTQIFSKIAAIFFLAGVFTCTWDTLLVAEVGGFTLKIHQLLFLLSFISILVCRRKENISLLLEPLRSGFPICILALSFYYCASSPWSEFPLKSFLYSGWLAFNLFTIWYSAQLQRESLSIQKIFLTLWGAVIFLSLVVLVDQIAYPYGFKAGLMGNNQDYILRWGVSRPHGFASEPSYLATFMGLSVLLIYPFQLPIPKFLVFGSLAVALFSFFCTGSRSGWAGLGIGIALILLLQSIRSRIFPWKQLFFILLISGAGISSFLLFMPEEQMKKFNYRLVNTIIEGNDGSGRARFRAHILAYDVAKEKNWLGTGIGASYKYWARLGRDKAMLREDAKSFNPTAYGKELIMSTWGQLFAEGGIPGLFLYMLAAIFLLVSLFRSWWNSGRSEALNVFVSGLVFFGFYAFMLGNVARGDVWIWFALWTLVSSSIYGSGLVKRPGQ